MLVLIQVSSMKTSLSGSSLFCQDRQRRRRIVLELGLREMTERGRFRAWGIL